VLQPLAVNEVLPVSSLAYWLPGDNPRGVFVIKTPAFFKQVAPAAEFAS